MYGQAAIKEPLCWLNRNKAFSVRETAWPPRRINGVTHFTPPQHRGMHRGRMEQWPTPGTCRSHSAATRRWLCPRLPSLAGPTSEPHGLVESGAYLPSAEACPCGTGRAKDHHKCLWSTSQSPRQRLFMLVLKHPAAILYILKRTFHLRPSFQLWN